MHNLLNYRTIEKGKGINGEGPARTMNFIEHRLCKYDSLDPSFSVCTLKGFNESFLSKYVEETEENNINRVVTSKQLLTIDGSDDE